MRIRQVKPSFWTDPETGRWPAETQTLYMRLWNLADDVGWLEWSPDVIGALAYPYLPNRRRVALIEKHAVSLAGKWLVVYDCGCGHLPKMEGHQRVTGKRAIYAYQKHQEHLGSHPVLTDKHTVAKSGYPSVDRAGVAQSGYPVLTDKHVVAPERGKEVKGKGKGERKEERGKVNGSAREKETFPPIGSVR